MDAKMEGTREDLVRGAILMHRQEASIIGSSTDHALVDFTIGLLHRIVHAKSIRQLTLELYGSWLATPSKQSEFFEINRGFCNTIKKILRSEGDTWKIGDCDIGLVIKNENENSHIEKANFTRTMG